MNIEINLYGQIVISAFDDANNLFTQTYTGYSKKDAKQKFKDDLQKQNDKYQRSIEATTT